jgi:hypothetical protein
MLSFMQVGELLDCLGTRPLVTNTRAAPFMANSRGLCCNYVSPFIWSRKVETKTIAYIHKACIGEYLHLPSRTSAHMLYLRYNSMGLEKLGTGSEANFERKQFIYLQTSKAFTLPIQKWYANPYRT